MELEEDGEQEDGEQEDGEQEDGEQEEHEEAELDEHVWTSPKNVIEIVQKLCDELCNIDPKHENEYKENTERYIEKLTTLSEEFEDVVEQGKRKEIIVADRFPFRYLVEDYGLNYYAAFPGCSTETEASAATVAFLVDKVKTDKIPVVFHIELSNEQMCDSICSATGSKNHLLHAAHNISKEDFNKGVTYVDLMEHNVQVLKEALN
jgi:zinc transport system substrate-binding protein